MRFALPNGLRAACIPLTATLALTACGGPTLLDLPVREGPQTVHPGDAARGLTTPIGVDQPGATSQLESLFLRICAANPEDAEAAIIAAETTGLFTDPITANDAADIPTTRLTTAEGDIEVVIQEADRRGITCGIGNADGTETYVLLPEDTA